MDEEDGREGLKARQSGAADVPGDAEAEILRRPERANFYPDRLYARTAAEMRAVRPCLRWPAAAAARTAYLRVTEGESR